MPGFPHRFSVEVGNMKKKQQNIIDISAGKEEYLSISIHQL